MEQVNILDWTPFAYENITVSNIAVSRLTELYRNMSGAVFLTFENNNINYRIDSGDPTAILGHQVVSNAYQNLWLSSPASIRNLRMIGIGGNSLAKVTYYRRQ